MNNMAEIRVETGDEPVITEAFIGTWLVEPESEQACTNEKGYGRNAFFGVAVTKRGQIAVCSGHRYKQWATRLAAYESLEAAGDDLPSNVTRAEAIALGYKRIVHRDI